MSPKVKYLQYESLAELYEHYVREFVLQSPIVAACGCRIHCREHHFAHIVKLFGPHGARVDFRVEKPTIMQTTAGFGNYTHEARRGTRLLAFLETIRTPDYVVRSNKLKTADRAFIKMYDCSQYPCMVVLAVREGDKLLLGSNEPVHPRHVDSWMEGEMLYSRNSSAAHR